VTVLSDILVANNLPPTTAIPVQMAWPITPPNITPKGSFADARAMVAIYQIKIDKESDKKYHHIIH